MKSVRRLFMFVLTGFLFNFPVLAQDAAAKIIQQKGTNQWRLAIGNPWHKTKLNQTLAEGEHLKTGKQSKLALLFRDDSQLRLNQNSLLIIKDVLDKNGKSTRFKLDVGRAWVKSKNIPDRLIMETPSAVAAIRGTDWDIEVAKNGQSTLTVLHGSIHFYNTHGAITVNANEQAIAEVGKAPVKLIIANPKDRIQWVTEYQLNPNKFNQLPGAGSNLAIQILQTFNHSNLDQYLNQIEQLVHSQFKTALLADIYLYQGDTELAIKTILAFKDYEKTTELKILKGKAGLMLGEANLLDNKNNNNQISLYNAQVHLFNGHSQAAISLFETVIARDKNNQEAWYQLGKIYTEKEHIKLAMQSLNKAISLKPNDAKSYSEKATLLTFTNQFKQAEESFSTAENHAANQALTFTGRGILSLKQGKTLEAKNYFLQAGVLQPQLARIHTYLAVSYYHLGETKLAIKTLENATELDDKDPLPYFMLSNIQRDQFDPKSALSSSKKAVKRLPYLKSLNQLANNLAGNANLGAALADYGLNDWATKYAVDSYNPFWAGSQLFLSHRFDNDRFIQQSELFKGILNDPLVFGASNQHTELVQQPGIYGTLRWQKQRTKANNYSSDAIDPILAINGMNNTLVPIAYFFEKTAHKLSLNYQEEQGSVNASPKFTRIGLGVKATPKFSLFAYNNSGGGTSTNNTLNDNETAQIPIKLLTTNDLDDSYYGLQYQFTPTNDISLSHFDIKDSNVQNSSLNSTLENVTGDFISITEIQSDQVINIDKSIVSSQLNWRYKTQKHHFFDLGFAIDENESYFKFDTNQHGSSSAFYLGELINNSEFENHAVSTIFDKNTIKQAYLHWQSNIHKQWYLDTLINYHKVDTEHTEQHENTIIDTTFSQLKYSDSHTAIGFGIKYSFNSHWLLRTSFQDWINSGAVVTSGPTMLAGIPLSTQYSVVGSEINRFALQLEYESKHIFAKLFAEQQRIDNTQLPESFVNNSTDLLDDNIRQLSAINNEINNLYDVDNEYYGAPKYTIVKGKVQNYYLVLNGYLSERLSGALSYQYSDTEQWDPNSNIKDKTFMQHHARSKFHFGFNYTAKFNGTAFIQGSYYQYPALETDLHDNWIWNLGWRQEFFNKRALLTFQRVIRGVDDTKLWHIIAEVRF